MISGLLMLCMMCMVLPGASIVSLAAGAARVSFSDPTVTVGEDVDITMKFASTDGTVLGHTKTVLSYDTTMLEYIGTADLLEGGAGTLIVRSEPKPEGITEVTTILKFKALQAGTTEIKVIDWSAYDNDATFLSEVKEGSSSVTIKSLPTSSTDATLKNLKISPGNLKPAFTPGVETYQVNVGMDTDKLTVSASANNDGAKTALEGAEGLQEGENTVICKVTAEDGVTVKEYKIIVNKFAGGETEAAESEGESETAAPEEEALVTLKSLAKELYILPLSADAVFPEGFRESTIAVGEVQVKGLVSSAETGEPSYCLFYARNEAGDKGWYRYDRDEKTIQRYFEDPSLPTKFTDEQYDTLVNDNNKLNRDIQIRLYIIIALGVTAGVLLILLIVTIRKKSRPDNRSFQPREPEEELKTYIPVSRGSGKKLSKEERYMLGEEEELEEYEDVDISAVQAAVTLDGMEEELVSRLAEDAERAGSDDDDFEIFDL